MQGLVDKPEDKKQFRRPSIDESTFLECYLKSAGW